MAAVAAAWRPGGGQSTATGLFTGIAKAGNQAGATNLTLLRTIGDGDHVVAWITFEWKNPGSEDTVPNSALEVWSFSGDRVQEIKAFYWDAAAISQPQHA